MLSEEPALLTEGRGSSPLVEGNLAASCAGSEAFSFKDEDELSLADFGDVREESFPSVTDDRDDRFLMVDSEPSSVDFRDA